MGFAGWSVQCQHLTLLSVEVHVATRSDLRPDPEFDEIRALFYCLHVDRPTLTSADSEGVIVVSRDRRPLLAMTGVSGSDDLTVEYVDSEIELLSSLTSLVTQYVPPSSLLCTGCVGAAFVLTVCRPLLPYGYSYKASCTRPG